ncbi:M48 family metalloprotease [Paraferrimonas sp. SM1919]|uniref:beta-barrel assembly-enhancing protease n=1 Tax=Paraferrimonas sp. SM1919 TaxID=2662263 RepID=UPI001F088EA9|nr:M48 family metalloprotease [Paraferrimonas sp. SM1919]
MNKNRKALWLAAALFCSSTNAQYSHSNLPDLGTAAVNTLSIEKEMLYGDAYMRVIRSSAPIADDPVLNQYISELGAKLVGNAEDVKTPFYFFLLQNNEINAFAFFGGHVGVHTGLFLAADNEAQLASVLAHEVTHVTQRHLARTQEAAAKTGPASMVGLLGSILLTIAAPQAGMAALATTQALATQSKINYTRLHEKEADRIGMATMVNAGFDPNGAHQFFGKLAKRYRYSSTIPQMLLTHPIPESRITEARARAANYNVPRYKENLDFHLAKARIEVRFSRTSAETALANYQAKAKKNQYLYKEAADYGLALAYFEVKDYQQSQKIIDRLLAQDPNNLFYIDTKSDLLLALDKHQQAIELLNHHLKLKPTSTVILANLAYSYIQYNQAQKAIPLLENIAYLDKQSMLPYSMLISAYQKLGNKAKEHLARAELLALSANYKNAIDQLNFAYRLTQEDPLQSARIEARIRQFRSADQALEALK